MENARSKAVEVMDRLGGVGGDGRSRLVIGTDTVVVGNEEILEKPHTNQRALQMLQMLNRCEHYLV